MNPLSYPAEPLTLPFENANAVVRLEFPAHDYLYWLYYGSIFSAVMACIVVVGVIAWPASKYYFGGGFVFFMFIAVVLYVTYQIKVKIQPITPMRVL